MECVSITFLVKAVCPTWLNPTSSTSYNQATQWQYQITKHNLNVYYLFQLLLDLHSPLNNGSADCIFNPLHVGIHGV